MLVFLLDGFSLFRPGLHVGVDGVDFLLPGWLGGRAASSRDDVLLSLAGSSSDRIVGGKFIPKFSLFPLRFLPSEVPCPAGDYFIIFIYFD